MAGAILCVRGLTRTYTVSQGWWSRSRTVPALDGVSFDVPFGRTLAVVGESGCGKSTLARLAALVERPSAGKLAINGSDVQAGGARLPIAVRRTVQMVFQNPYASLNPRATIGRSVGEALVAAGWGTPARRQAAVAEMLRCVGLEPDHASRYPHTLSGGQRQRVAIARALILRPKLVVADEPTASLDPSVRAQVVNLLIDLQRDFGVAYLFLSHDLPLVRHVADRVLVLYLGRTAEYGPAEVIFSRPRHPYTQALLASVPHPTGGRMDKAGQQRPLRGEPAFPLDPPEGCAFHPRCPRATAHCAVATPRLRRIDSRLVACHYADDADGSASSDGGSSSKS